MHTVPFQPDLRPALPCVFGAKDYREYRDTLVEMDRILAESGLEDAFVRRHLGACSEKDSERKRGFRAKVARKALRHAILLAVTGLSVRELATRLPDNSRRGALNFFTTDGSPQTGHCTSDFWHCPTKSASEANQPSNTCPIPHCKSNTFTKAPICDAANQPIASSVTRRH